MKAHHALGAFSFVGMLALVYGTWMLLAKAGWPVVGQILALVIGAAWVWAAMEADQSLSEETKKERREIGGMLKDIAEREHEHHQDEKQPQAWHG
jgi:amino acid transporter